MPKNISIYAHLYVGEDSIEIQNIKGDVDVGVETGPVVLKNIEGSVQATIYSFYGKSITAIYNVLPKGSIHYYSTHKGDINITIPGNVHTTVTSNIKSDGLFNSDFISEIIDSNQDDKSETKFSNMKKHSVKLNKAEDSEMSIYTIKGNIILQKSN